MNVNIKNESGFPLEYASVGSVGLDLRACVGTDRIIDPGRRFKFDTGISLELPDGYGALVLPRSGLSLHHGVISSVGVIDQDYRGRIGVVLFNRGTEGYKVLSGDGGAQLVILPVPRLANSRLSLMRWASPPDKVVAGWPRRM
jgi:dUTP pyrophosphatase